MSNSCAPARDTKQVEVSGSELAAHGDFHSCPPPALLLSSGGPSRSTRVWGERATNGVCQLPP